MPENFSKNFEVKTLPLFDKALKRLIRKFPSLKKEYESLLDTLEVDPRQGTALANNCYKIRIAIASKGKGKSGGGRAITHIIVTESIVYLLFIYDKSERDDISQKELEELLKMIK